MSHFRHTDKTDAVIRAGYADNIPIAHIAEKLGITRNAVIGRANRLGLSNDARRVFAVQSDWFKSKISVAQTLAWANGSRRKAARS